MLSRLNFRRSRLYKTVSAFCASSSKSRYSTRQQSIEERQKNSEEKPGSGGLLRNVGVIGGAEPDNEPLVGANISCDPDRRSVVAARQWPAAECVTLDRC